MKISSILKFSAARAAEVNALFTVLSTTFDTIRSTSTFTGSSDGRSAFVLPIMTKLLSSLSESADFAASRSVFVAISFISGALTTAYTSRLPFVQLTVTVEALSATPYASRASPRNTNTWRLFTFTSSSAVIVVDLVIPVAIPTVSSVLSPSTGTLALP